ncbi:hypothetical protein Lal_00006662 [Lupinus albus]|nr:hypothetical protein Lal_00006662 [Lupinus albus]
MAICLSHGFDLQSDSNSLQLYFYAYSVKYDRSSTAFPFYNSSVSSFNNLRTKLSGSSGSILIMVSSSGTGTTRRGCDPTILWRVSMRHCLHLGQDECKLSHLSIQGTWKPWLHLGKMRTFSSLVNSERHITHSVSIHGRFISVE